MFPGLLTFSGPAILPSIAEEERDLCVTHFLTLEEHFRIPKLPIRDGLQVWISGWLTLFYVKGPGWREERGSVYGGCSLLSNQVLGFFLFLFFNFFFIAWLTSVCGLQICPIWDTGFLCECTPVFTPVAMRANLGSYREWCGVEVFGGPGKCDSVTSGAPIGE